MSYARSSLTSREAEERPPRPRAGDAPGPEDRDPASHGAAIYWCEGAKSKPWRELQTLDFINSDPSLIELYLRFLAACGVERDQIKCRLTIHETADAEAATAWWRDRLGLHDVYFGRPTIKRHKPATARRNVNDDYHGCLIVRLGRHRELYWSIEGLMSGIVAAANQSSPAREG